MDWDGDGDGDEREEFGTGDLDKLHLDLAALYSAMDNLATTMISCALDLEARSTSHDIQIWPLSSAESNFIQTLNAQSSSSNSSEASHIALEVPTGPNTSSSHPDIPTPRMGPNEKNRRAKVHMDTGPAAGIPLRDLIPEYRPPLAICRTGSDEKQGLVGQTNRATTLFRYGANYHAWVLTHDLESGY
ncbi:uncharacterized protein EAF02_001316 [Botrytis sinoallii]|uniref:uncharacterized protein n=1 Tax=Botrytis sinoallii TaxID=1463999 RepID=UPI0019016361|nr:uncharacterized protein EAF02_001316 [Botrytis sinoallii]KAF7890991.1 hypothetical protein EAF02_001316 [Botrytis sinoallii]